MHLALGSARADSAPGHKIANVLRGNDVEELASRRHAMLVDAHEEIARYAQSFVDAEAAVQVRVVDQSFPAHGGARLLKIHAHQDFQLARMIFPFAGESLGIRRRGRGVVDGAWPDHHQQPVGASVQDLAHVGAGFGNLGFDRGALDREESDQMLGRRQRNDVVDALVVCEGGLVVDGLIHGGLGQKKTARLLALAVFLFGFARA
jgi:hypothetical protein